MQGCEKNQPQPNQADEARNRPACNPAAAPWRAASGAANAAISSRDQVGLQRSVTLDFLQVAQRARTNRIG